MSYPTQQIELGWVNRPARRQVDETTLKKADSRTHLTHNIWQGYSLDKPSGPDRPPLDREKRQRSLYRCRPELDVGRTRGSDVKQRTFCLYFAKGCCGQGSACIYLHRVPTEEDSNYHSKMMGFDIFGREKRGENEGFRKGAGTLERDNRTLYCNYEGAGGSFDKERITKLVESNFGPWGPIKRIYIVMAKMLAFVEFEWRCTAEFAKEAMHKQGLIGSNLSEVLDIRWSNEDPNPVTIIAQKKSHIERFEKAAMESFEALPEERKMVRMQQLEMVQAMQDGHVISSYPATDEQFDRAEREGGEDQDQAQEYDESHFYEDQLNCVYEPDEVEAVPNQVVDGPKEPGPSGASTGDDKSRKIAEDPKKVGEEQGGGALGMLGGYGSDEEEQEEPSAKKQKV